MDVKKNMKTYLRKEQKRFFSISTFVNLFCIIWVVVIMFLFVVINGTYISTVIVSHLGLSDQFNQFIGWLQPIFTAKLLE